MPYIQHSGVSSFIQGIQPSRQLQTVRQLHRDSSAATSQAGQLATTEVGVLSQTAAGDREAAGDKGS